MLVKSHTPPKKILRNAYTLVRGTNYFELGCFAWDKKPAADKTWQTFKTHFAEEELTNEEYKSTSQQKGYANQAIDDFANQTSASFANLAAATAADRQMMADLVAQNKILLEQLAAANKELTTLCARLHNNNDNNNSRRNKKRFNNQNYCWSCGYDVSTNHTSETCNTPKPGHNKTATRENNLGGSQLNKNKVY